MFKQRHDSVVGLNVISDSLSSKCFPQNTSPITFEKHFKENA